MNLYIASLIYNLSFMFAMGVISSFIRQSRRRKTGQDILQGLLFGISAIIGMLLPLVLGQGLIFDGRSVMICLCGLFFGPTALGVAGGMALFYRVLVVGGYGSLTGGLVIASSALIGLAFFYRWTRKGTILTAGRLLTVGLLVHVAMALLMFTLPGGRGFWVIRHVGLPILLLYPLATLLIGKVLATKETELRFMEASRESRRALYKGRAEMRTLIDTIPDLIWFKDPAGVYLACNPRFERFFGAREQEIVGRTDHDFVNRELADAFREYDRKAMAAGGPSTNEEWITFADDGHQEYLETIKTPIFGKGGELLGILGIGRDITRRKAAETEILRMNEDLEQRVLDRTARLEAANQEMESFSYSVSHDLRSPLRSIDGFSQILLEDYRAGLDEAGRHYLSRIRLGAQRMGQIIDDLLRMSRIDRTELARTEVDLSALGRAVADSLARADPGRRVELSIQPGLRAWADMTLLQTVLENLLGNAWKFTRRRPDPRIELGGTVSAQGEAILFIRDNGAGFDMAYADRLYRSFQRLHSVEDFEGTGIGLTIVQRILHRHGGRIWADSRPDGGATFFFTLPEPSPAVL